MVLTTKAGMIDYVLEKRPRYLLIDEIDKMSSKDHTFLLNLMESGIISETKYGKTRSAQIKTSVFATSNNIERLSAPLRSRFFIVELGPYTYEQFFEITKQLLSHQRIEREVTNLIARAVWTKSQDIRDCIKIASMAKTIEDVDFLVNMLNDGRGANKMHPLGLR